MNSKRMFFKTGFVAVLLVMGSFFFLNGSVLAAGPELYLTEEDVGCPGPLVDITDLHSAVDYDSWSLCFPPENDTAPDCSKFPWLCFPPDSPECSVGWVDCVPPGDDWVYEFDGYADHFLNGIDQSLAVRPNPIFIYGGQNSGWGTLKLALIYSGGAGGGGGDILNPIFIYDGQGTTLILKTISE